MIEIEGFRRERGLLWPDDDRHCCAVTFGEVKNLNPALLLLQKRRVAVQAGGNCGVWALALAAVFEAVYTFEPDQKNFTALAVNTANVANVVALRAAVGDNAELVGMIEVEKNNCGAHRVALGAGLVPTIRIDDLGLSHCDLIVLDIEGRELSALKGAMNTIRSKRPVIMFEDKGLSTHYGVQQGMAEKWLEDQYNYAVVERVGRDVLCAPLEMVLDRIQPRTTMAAFANNGKLMELGAKVERA